MSTSLRQKLLILSLLALSPLGNAELKELDDQSLEEQKGQAGITIDIEFELSIGEMAYQPGDSYDAKARKPQSYQAEPPPRIDYVLPDKK